MARTSLEQLKREALAGVAQPFPKIVTTHVYPPIPVRTFDWHAYFDGEEESGIDGYGSTREEAIADFMANAVCEDRVSPTEALRLIDEAANA
jgi:hypothetical protein